MHGSKAINWNVNFENVFNWNCHHCLSDIKDIICHLKFISDFFVELDFKKILHIWELFDLQTIDQLSELFIEKNKNIFDKLQENEKTRTIIFLKSYL